MRTPPPPLAMRAPGVAAALLVVATAQACAAPARAAHPRLEEAEALARRNEPAAAIDAYRSLLRDGVDGPAVRYNLGTLALAQGQLGEAVLQLRTARRMDPLDDDIQHNLAVALEARVDRLAGDPVVAPLAALGEALPPRAARLAPASSLMLLGVALALLAVEAIRSRSALHRALRMSVAVLAATSVVGVGLYGARRSREGTREAVVLADTARALREPSPRAQEAFTAHAGLSGDVVDELDGFVRVRFENGLEAWLRATDVGFVGSGGA